MKNEQSDIVLRMIVCPVDIQTLHHKCKIKHFIGYCGIYLTDMAPTPEAICVV